MIVHSLMILKQSTFHRINSKMDPFTKASGRSVCVMDVVSSSGRMDRYTKVTGETTWLTAREDSSTPTLMVSEIIITPSANLVIF